MPSFVKTTEIYTSDDNTEFPFALFGNSSNGLFGWYDGSPASYIYHPWSPSFVNGAFQSYDFKPQFDDTVILANGQTARQTFASARWMDIGGILIETNTGELQIAFRAPGSTFIPSPGWYQEQALSAIPTGGQRMVAFDTVPIVNGCCEISFTMKNYPDNGVTPGIGSSSAVGWNLKIKKFGR